MAEDWEGNMEIDFDTFRPNLTNFESEDALRVELDRINGEIWWGHGRGHGH